MVSEPLSFKQLEAPISCPECKKTFKVTYGDVEDLPVVYCPFTGHKIDNVGLLRGRLPIPKMQPA